MAKTTICNTSAIQPFSPSIRKDDRYVPLKVSQCAVFSALNNPSGPAVVLLHGGVGTGKSCLARYTTLHYREAASEKCVFDHVVYLECGPQAESLAKQFELLKLLGAGGSASTQQDGFSIPELLIPRLLQHLLKDEKLLVVLDDVWEGEFLQTILDLCGSRVKCLVTSQLRNLCRGLNGLSIDIRMEDIQLDDAREILANHVRLPHRFIPQHLEVIADEIVHLTQANPLALASIATAIYRSDERVEWEAALSSFFQLLHSKDTALILSKKYPISFWAAMRLSVKLLKEEERKLLILMHMFEGPSVPEEVIHVLHRSVKCQEDSATFEKIRNELESRELVRISVTSDYPVKQRSWSVHSLQKRYIDNEMRDARESMFTSLEGLWGIDTEHTVELEIDVDYFWEVEIVLGALYFDNQFAKMAALKVGIPFYRFDILRRNAIEPVSRFLGHIVSEQWTDILQASTRKVFLCYICNAVLHNDSISNLLASPVSSLAMLSALENIAAVEETNLLDENMQGFMKILVEFLGDGKVHPRVREATGRVLRCLCHNEQHCSFIVSKLPDVLDTAIRVLWTDSDPVMQSSACWILAELSYSQVFGQYPKAFLWLLKSLSKTNNPSLNEAAAWTLANLVNNDHGQTKLKITNSLKALKALVKALSKDDNPGLQCQAGRIFASLTGVQGDDETKMKIINCPRAMEELVKWLSDDHNRDLQEQVASTLANLAGGEEKAKVLVASCHTVRKLVKALSKDNKPLLQVEAARALANLAIGDSNLVKLNIVNAPGALEEFVKSLSLDNKPDLQAHSANTLAYLAIGDCVTQLKVLNSSGAVEELVKVLSKNNNPNLQHRAAMALASLASGDGERKLKKLKIANTPGAVMGLVKSLTKDSNPSLKQEAAKALAYLATGDHHEIKLMIVNCPGALEELVKSMSQDVDPYLQCHAARALAKLAAGKGEKNLKIVNCPGSVEELVRLLSKDNNHGLQQDAARALANLSSGDCAEIKLKVVNFPGALEELVKSLAKDVNPDLQHYAARALAKLAAGGDDKKLKIASSAGSIEELVKFLSKDNCPSLQQDAARALANLASGDDGKIKLQILNSPGALEELVSLLSKDSNPDAQGHAARALANLAAGDRETGLKVIDSSGVLEELVKSLSKVNNPDLQRHASLALANLAAGDGEKKLKKMKLANYPVVVEELLNLLSSNNSPSLQQLAARTLHNIITSKDTEE